jgi:hypothetical protein
MANIVSHCTVTVLSAGIQGIFSHAMSQTGTDLEASRWSFDAMTSHYQG